MSEVNSYRVQQRMKRHARRRPTVEFAIIRVTPAGRRTLVTTYTTEQAALTVADLLRRLEGPRS